jgi:hypothetical protein
MQEAQGNRDEEERKTSEQETQKLNEALLLNKEGLSLYYEGRTKEEKKKYSLAISKYEDATIKFKEAHTIKELDETFNSFLLAVESFIELRVILSKT